MATRKIALVTGASSGIGQAAVKRLIAAGYVTYAAARRLDRMKTLEELGAVLLPLDLTDDASIVRTADRIRTEQGRIDVLLNNAGYGSYGAVEDVALAEARRQFEVNVFGLARLIQLLTPLMRAQRSGRIVNVSSIGGKVWEPLGAWYHATKFAVEGLSDCLRMELKPFGIHVIVIEPGAINTEWTGIALDTLDRASGQTVYAAQAAEKRALFLSAAESGSGPDVVARAIVGAVSARRPRIRYVVGAYARPAVFMAMFLPDRFNDWVLAAVAKSAHRQNRTKSGARPA